MSCNNGTCTICIIPIFITHVCAVTVMKDTQLLHFNGHSFRKQENKLQNSACIDITVQGLGLGCFKGMEIIGYRYSVQSR